MSFSLPPSEDGEDRLELVLAPPPPGDTMDTPLDMPPPPVMAEEQKPPATKKRKKKRDKDTMRKAPNAPKRFKSSYICFFMAKQPEIKQQLGPDASVAAVSKRSAELWKALSASDRAFWDEAAARDKARYNYEKSQYKGPWQVQWKRTRKDPSAPRRPMSAFLYFSQGRRSQIKQENPDMKNTQISAILGERWRNLSEEEKAPHVEKEQAERAKYKVAIAKWKAENEAKLEEQRRIAAEQAELAASLPPEPPQAFQDPFLFPAPAPGQTLPNSALFPGNPPAPYPLPTSGKPIILGPSGAPHYTTMVTNHMVIPPMHHFDESAAAFDFGPDQDQVDL